MSRHVKDPQPLQTLSGVVLSIYFVSIFSSFASFCGSFVILCPLLVIVSCFVLLCYFVVILVTWFCLLSCFACICSHIVHCHTVLCFFCSCDAFVFRCFAFTFSYFVSLCGIGLLLFGLVY